MAATLASRPSAPARERHAAGELEDLEVALLLEAIHQRRGFDFRGYALSPVRRRIRAHVQEESVRTVAGLLEKVLHDDEAMERLVLGLSVTTTSMFRDPGFFRALREKVVPVLRTYPFLRIWHAGCSSGEEVYSLAILLTEEGLYPRSRIYATDIHPRLLQQAAAGVVELASARRWESAYRTAGGRLALSSYYRPHGRNAVLAPELRRNVVFAQHNLTTDGSFNEFNLVLCRNVLIYFNAALQERAHRLVYESLARFGFLALGRRETIALSPHERRYAVVDGRENLYRKAA